MNKEKQIEEMAKMFCGITNGCDDCMFDKANCFERKDAEELYKSGYRKQSEVARDIVTEFANMLRCHSFYMTDAYGEINENIVTVKTIAEVEEELKKKYTEGENESRL